MGWALEHGAFGYTGGMKGQLRRLSAMKLAFASLLIVFGARVAVADPPKAPPPGSARQHAAAKPPPKKPPSPPEAGTPATTVPIPPPASLAPPTADVLNDAGVVEAKTLDGGTRVFKFSELDIEGRLKSPQLVYFLRRVRAEFAAGDLGHRSFLHEMSETRKESSF